MQVTSNALGLEALIIRSRLRYLALALGTMLLGLASRSKEIPLPEFMATYAGDTLWALLVFWLVRGLKPSLSPLLCAFIAIGFSFLIEFSQLYNAPWIDGIRSTTLGGLVLGFGFMPSDLLCYCLGVFIGYLLDVKVAGRFTHAHV